MVFPKYINKLIFKLYIADYHSYSNKINFHILINNRIKTEKHSSKL